MDHLPGGAGGVDDVAVGHGDRREIMLEERERLHGVGAGGLVHDIHVVGMQVHRDLVAGQEFLHAPDMVEMPVRQEDGVGGKPVGVKETGQFAGSVGGRHAGIRHRTVLPAVLPQHYAVGAERIESEYSGMKHLRILLIPLQIYDNFANFVE